MTPYVIYKWPTLKKIQARSCAYRRIYIPTHVCVGRPLFIDPPTDIFMYVNPQHPPTPQRAAYLKEEGNKAFKAQDMAKAESRYSEAIGVLQVRTCVYIDMYVDAPAFTCGRTVVHVYMYVDICVYILAHLHTLTHLHIHIQPQLATDAELSNPEKARKLEVLVPTLNNLGAARLKSRRFEQAYVVARSVSGY